MTGSPRALMPDYLRLVALFGIVVVNVQFIAFSALGSFADPGGETLRDAITLWLVNGLALLKTYGLFSFRRKRAQRAAPAAPPNASATPAPPRTCSGWGWGC
jgi:hypothetical protein